MLKIIVGAEDYFDNSKQEFSTQGGTVLDLEHSLVSLSKWEQITKKPFLGDGEKSSEEVYTYIKCMANTEIPPEVFSKLSQKNIDDINDYINDKPTATWFTESKSNSGSGEVITSELIYYWLSSFGIPYEVQQWHLNRLFTFIKIFDVKNSPKKKMSRDEIVSRQRALNAKRRAETGSNG